MKIIVTVQDGPQMTIFGGFSDTQKRYIIYKWRTLYKHLSKDCL